MPRTICQCSGQLWLLWVVRCPLLLFLVGRMCWPTLTERYGKWVQSQAGRVPSIWSASPETMPAKGVVFRFWIFGSLLDDGIYCHAFEGGRASRLDDVTFQSSSWHHYRRAVNAVASSGRQQQYGSVASHRGLPLGDWEKERRRHLSGIILLHFISVSISFPHSSCWSILEDGNRWLLLFWPDGKEQIEPVSSDSRDL